MKQKLVLTTFLLFMACLSAKATVPPPPTYSVSINGITSITNFSNVDLYFNDWQVEYGPVGFATSGAPSTIATIYSGHVTALAINPFLNYDVRIRNQMTVGWTEWSDVTTIINCNDTYQTAGYTFNFDSDSGHCWRGYASPTVNISSTYVASTDFAYEGTTGKSVKLYSSANNNSAVLVTPKFSDLSTDKKITFSLYGFNSGTLKIVSLSNPYDFSTQSVITEIPFQESEDEWELITAHLNNYNGTDPYIAIVYTKTIQNGGGDIYIDNFSYLQSVNCFDPHSLAVTNVTQHTAQVNFNGAGQSQWEVQLSNGLFGEPQVFTVNSSSFLLEDLYGDAPYTIKVRAVCGPDHYSDWTPLTSFNTPCDNVTAGYTTSFEDYFLMPECWSRTGSSPLVSVQMSDSYNYTTAIVVTPRTGSKMVRIDNTFISSGSPDAYLVSPYLADLDNTKQVEFYLQVINQNYNTNTLTVGTMSDPADASTFVPIKTITPDEMVDATFYNPNRTWRKHIVYFNDYNTSSNHHYIAIRHDNQMPNTAFLIDDFSYKNIPQCTEPQVAKVVGLEHDLASISWTNAQTSTATQWQIEYGPAGFAHGSGIIATVNSNPATISDLEQSTTYDFYVRSVCGSSYSDWSSVENFTTRCSITPGYTHDFENDEVNTMNSCWRRLTPSFTGYFWRPQRFINTVSSTQAPNVAHSGTKSVMIYNEWGTTEQDVPSKNILVTPKLNGFDNMKTISFWMYGTSSGTPEQIIVGTLSDPDNATTFTPYYTINATEVVGQWVQYTINFSGYTGTDEYIGFKQTSTSGSFRIFIDDFSYNAITCAKPTALAAQQSGTGSALLSWTNNSTNAVSFEVEYSGQWSQPGYGTVITANTNFATIDELEPQFNYQFRVRALCDDETYSDWSPFYIFSMSCPVTAPLNENFDNYDPMNPDDFCWKPNAEMLAGVWAFCLDSRNSCPNALRLTRLFEESGLIVSPYLLDFDNTKKIRFFAYAFLNENYNTMLEVGTVSNPADPSTFVPYTTISLFDIKYGKEFEVDFSQYTGTAKQIYFRHSFDLDTYIYIDDVEYSEIGACAEPLNVLAQNVNSNSALITWETPGQAPIYKIEYGVHGFTQGTGTIVTTEGTDKLIEDLTPLTQYDFYIQSVCEGDIESVTIGPKSFTTTCISQQVPWVENFDNMPEYGMNKVPECFRILNGEIQAYNQATPALGNSYGNDHIMTGVNDTHFLRVTGFESSMITPMVSLTAGTTYTFSYKIRSAYEFSNNAIDATIGQGNNLYNMITPLNRTGTMSEYQYNTFSHQYTPLESGDYSFLLNMDYDGSQDILLDNMQLQEGYTSIINSDSFEVDFEDGIPEELIVEATDNTYNFVITDNTNVLIMQGGTNSTNWVNIGQIGGRLTKSGPTTDVWLNNENFINKVNMKVDASAMQSLTLSFDLKQTFNDNNNESMFRVIVNGIAVGSIIKPDTQTGDTYINHQFDLTPFVGGDIKISLQHLGKSSSGNGDNAYLDNINIQNTVLSTKDNIFNKLKLYPNPAKDIVTIENAIPISQVEIYNISGQQLFSNTYNTTRAEVNISDYSSGVYFITVGSGDNRKVFKIIKN